MGGVDESLGPAQAPQRLGRVDGGGDVVIKVLPADVGDQVGVAQVQVRLFSSLSAPR